MTTVQVGDEAPDFELRDQTGQPVRLSDYRGKKAVVLVFYPATFTRTCESEMCSIRDDLDTYRTDAVETVAISVDSPPAHRAWAQQNGFDFPILADFWPHGEVSQQYGAFNEVLGIAERATFIVDRDGKVVYTDASPIPEARDQEPWKEALRAIGAIG